MSSEIKADRWRHFCSIRNDHSHSVKCQLVEHMHPASLFYECYLSCVLGFLADYRAQGNVPLTHSLRNMIESCMYVLCTVRMELFSQFIVNCRFFLPYCKTCWSISFIYLLQGCSLFGHSNQNISTAQTISLITDMLHFTFQG